MLVHRCPVDAGGVPAEWIEATAATAGQPTLVCFAGPDLPREARVGTRPLAARLALATGARVLHVGCRVPSRPSRAVIEDVVAAWRWLLGEGCDVRTTAFIAPSADGARALDVLLEVRRRCLPLPLAGAWRADESDGPPVLASGGRSLSSRLHLAGAVELPARAGAALGSRTVEHDLARDGN